ncbi:MULTISPECIES: hypothetical protein [Gemella]|uniref:hypothetical protein n=1 Tax=Gemella TaxID=1378 RepID=UPI000767E7F6|nr:MULTISPECIES: hypothetical protein [Gemella]AME09485.1 hypothetical protein AXE85_04665 [Gemella sp. oral taxon 928]AXI27124.1 hypothetical protein CG018_06785 [Gemella sp. ND 6198]
MTKEERAIKWFRNIPNAELLDMKTKMNICSKVAKKVIIIFLILFAVEFILLFMISDGEIFSIMTNFLNNISEGSSTRNRYRRVAFIGGLICLPVVMLPLIIALIYKNKSLKSETAKATDP